MRQPASQEIDLLPRKLLRRFFLNQFNQLVIGHLPRRFLATVQRKIERGNHEKSERREKTDAKHRAERLILQVSRIIPAGIGTGPMQRLFPLCSLCSSWLFSAGLEKI